MTEAMKITLSTQPADARWGEKATYSINNDGITLHLNGKDDLGLIQRAARKIDGLGIKHVQLDGEGWDTERSWAFWQGYKGPKGTRKVEWAALDEAQRKELDSRLKIIDWVRDTINAPAEELGPEQLAQRAVDLLSLTASPKVKICASRTTWDCIPWGAALNVLQCCWRWTTTQQATKKPRFMPAWLVRELLLIPVVTASSKAHLWTQ